VAGPAGFPFTLPALEFQMLELHPEVTFLVGENGSGKSTLLEAIAAKRAVPGVSRRADLRAAAGGPVPTAYEDTDHYRLTRAFLDAPDRFLRELLS
jgi:predicted ATPase